MSHFQATNCPRIIVALSVAVFILANCAWTNANHIVGDMILTDDQYKAFTANQKGGDQGGENTEPDRPKRNAIRDQSYRWSKGVIPYVFDRSYSRKDKRTVKKAMSIWSKYTCIVFRAARRRDKNKIKIQNGVGCSAMVGMVDGTQQVNLQKVGCRDVATVLHELGHAIGLFHTQSRPDRDQHLKLDLSSVDESNHYNFQKKTWKEVHHYGVKYDFRSIMHYGSKDFGDESGKVIRTRDKKFQKIIGEATTLSFGDIEMVHKMYGCTPKSCKLKDSDCPGISFVDASCTCVCPGPNKSQLTQPCAQGPTAGKTGGQGERTTTTTTTSEPEYTDSDQPYTTPENVETTTETQAPEMETTTEHEHPTTELYTNAPTTTDDNWHPHDHSHSSTTDGYY